VNLTRPFFLYRSIGTREFFDKHCEMARGGDGCLGVESRNRGIVRFFLLYRDFGGDLLLHNGGDLLFYYRGDLLLHDGDNFLHDGGDLLHNGGDLLLHDGGDFLHDGDNFLLHDGDNFLY